MIQLRPRDKLWFLWRFVRYESVSLPQLLIIIEKCRERKNAFSLFNALQEAAYTGKALNKNLGFRKVSQTFPLSNFDASKEYAPTKRDPPEDGQED